jgi:hypothetical protein
MPDGLGAVRERSDSSETGRLSLLREWESSFMSAAPTISLSAAGSILTGSQTNQAALATLMARDDTKRPADFRKGARERLLADHEFMDAFRRAKERVRAGVSGSRGTRSDHISDRSECSLASARRPKLLIDNANALPVSMKMPKNTPSRTHRTAAATLSPLLKAARSTPKIRVEAPTKTTGRPTSRTNVQMRATTAA